MPQNFGDLKMKNNINKFTIIIVLVFTLTSICFGIIPPVPEGSPNGSCTETIWKKCKHCTTTISITYENLPKHCALYADRNMVIYYLVDGQHVTFPQGDCGCEDNA